MFKTEIAGKISAMRATRSFRAPALALLAAAAVLSGCGTPNRDSMTTAAIAYDFRLSLPIALAEAVHTLDIPVAAGDSRILIAMGDTVQGFAQDYRKRSSGVMRVEYPSGSANAAAASHMRRDLRRLLANAGVPSPRIIETSYQADPASSAPIRLSYVATTAMTSECGQWPKDIANDTSQNQNWYNFGCSTQNNLAAQLDNPMDLVAPRAMSPIDAENRTNVIQTYRGGKSDSK